MDPFQIRYSLSPSINLFDVSQSASVASAAVNPFLSSLPSPSDWRFAVAARAGRSVEYSLLRTAFAEYMHNAGERERARSREKG